MSKQNRKPVAYVFGPYTADTAEGIRHNIDMADRVGRELVLMGFAVIVPHNNSCGWERDIRFNYNHFLEMDFELLSRCDLLVPSTTDWIDSSGSVAEVELAKSLGIPIYYGLDHVPDAGWFYQ